MSMYKKGFSTSDTKPNTTNKTRTLNPNATEFVPFALKSSSERPGNLDGIERLDASGTSGKTVLNRSESTVSNYSDDEAHQYWCHQLPDDITPDFKLMGEEELQEPGSLPFSALSIHDGSGTLRFSTSTGSNHKMSKQQELPSHGIDGNVLIENMRYPTSAYDEGQSPTGFINLPTKPWNKQFVNSDQHLSNVRDGLAYNGNSSSGFLNDISSGQAVLDDGEINSVEFLASQFPGFSAESLAEVYYANGHDLNMTVEMLTQLELQVDGVLNQNLNSEAKPAPNLSALDFPALTVPDGQNGLPKYSGDNLQQTINPYRSAEKGNTIFFNSNPSAPSRGATDFASAVKKLAPQDSSQWKYERNGSADASVGSSRNSHILSRSYSGGQGRSIYADKLPNHGSARAAPVWLETGEAVANMYSETREEARDHARLRNLYFEQARQAYLVGNKALAKELSVKGQLHNMRMKSAHGKAQEAIYRQRNPISPEVQGYGRGQERMIDLHGLHVSEAIRVLRHELGVLKNAARSAEQRLQVYICVGTGHHTKGSRTPARLPVAVERYLLEEEGLDYTEPQPGLLRVVIY